MLSRVTKRFIKNSERKLRTGILKPLSSDFSVIESQSVSEIDMGKALNIDPDLLEEKVSNAEERDKVFTKKKLTMKDHIKVALHHIKHGFMGIYFDTKRLMRLLGEKQLRDEAYTIYELRERRRIVKDLIKFIPYSIFMTVPLLEAFLPLYIVLFPNSTPTHFLFENQIGEKTKELVKQQRDSYAKIIPLLPKFANVIGLDPLKFVQSITDIIEREGKEKEKMYYRVSDFESKLDSFVRNYSKMDNRCLTDINMYSLTAYELEQTAKLLTLDYIPGYNLINKCIWTFTRLPFGIYNFVKKKMKLDTVNFHDYGFWKFQFYFNKGPMKLVKKHLLIQQIRYHMGHIKVQDRQLARDLSQLDELNASDLSSIARQRGIKLDNSEDIKQYLIRYWLPLSVDYDLDIDVLIWVSFMRYSYVDVLV